MDKVNKIIAKAKQISTEDGETCIYLFNSMKALGEIVGINVEKFEERFFAGDMIDEAYSYIKEDNWFEAIWIRLHDTISSYRINMGYAWTIRLNLETREFICHRYINPHSNDKEEIEHFEYKGTELPEILFKDENTYNIKKHIANVDLEDFWLSQNVIYEIIQRIIENVEGVKSDDDGCYIWETNPKENDIDKTIGFYCPSLVSDLMPASLEESITIVDNNQDKIIKGSISSLKHLLQIREYVRKANARGKGPKKAIE